MAISKGDVVSLAFIRLGEVGNIYNDNSSDQYRIANSLLTIITNTIAIDNTFLFNATTAPLTRAYNQSDELGRSRYNVPVDYMNTVRCDIDITREGEFFYTESPDVPNLTYCRKIDFTEIPDYMFNYLVYALAVELTGAFSSYTDRAPIVLQGKNSELYRIHNMEGLAGDLKTSKYYNDNHVLGEVV